MFIIIQSRYPMYHRLCDGWDWKAWNEVQSRTQVQAAEYIKALGAWTYSISKLLYLITLFPVLFLQDSQGSKVWAPAMHTQGNICRWLFGPKGNTGNML